MEKTGGEDGDAAKEAIRVRSEEQVLELVKQIEDPGLALVLIREARSSNVRSFCFLSSLSFFPISTFSPPYFQKFSITILFFQKYRTNFIIHMYVDNASEMHVKP